MYFLAEDHVQFEVLASQVNVRRNHTNSKNVFFWTKSNICVTLCCESLKLYLSCNILKKLAILKNVAFCKHWIAILRGNQPC